MSLKSLGLNVWKRKETLCKCMEHHIKWHLVLSTNLLIQCLLLSYCSLHKFTNIWLLEISLLNFLVVLTCCGLGIHTLSYHINMLNYSGIMLNVRIDMPSCGYWNLTKPSNRCIDEGRTKYWWLFSCFFKMRTFRFCIYISEFT